MNYICLIMISGTVNLEVSTDYFYKEQLKYLPLQFTCLNSDFSFKKESTDVEKNLNSFKLTRRRDFTSISRFETSLRPLLVDKALINVF